MFLIRIFNMSDLNFQNRSISMMPLALVKWGPSWSYMLLFHSVCWCFSPLSFFSIPSAVTYLCCERFVPPQLLGALLPYILKLFVKNLLFLILRPEHSHTKKSSTARREPTQIVLVGEGFICTGSAVHRPVTFSHCFRY